MRGRALFWRFSMLKVKNELWDFMWQNLFQVTRSFQAVSVYFFSRTLASAGKELKDNFLEALAERMLPHRSGKMTGSSLLQPSNCYVMGFPSNIFAIPLGWEQNPYCVKLSGKAGPSVPPPECLPIAMGASCLPLSHPWLCFTKRPVQGVIPPLKPQGSLKNVFVLKSWSTNITRCGSHSNCDCEALLKGKGSRVSRYGSDGSLCLTVMQLQIILRKGLLRSSRESNITLSLWNSAFPDLLSPSETLSSAAKELPFGLLGLVLCCCCCG